MKGPAEQQDELTVDYFTEINDSRITLPRKPRMKDPVSSSEVTYSRSVATVVQEVEKSFSN